MSLRKHYRKVTVALKVKDLKDQISAIERKKRVAAVYKAGNFHRKNLLVNDGSLEAALSMVVDSGAEIFKDPPIIAAIDSVALSNEKLKIKLSSPLRTPNLSPSGPHSLEPLGAELRSYIPPSHGLSISGSNPPFAPTSGVNKFFFLESEPR